MNRSDVVLRLFVSFAVLLSATAGWTQVPENTYQELHWRMIGPFRGGRTRAAAGVPSQPNVFYVGQVNGGVWKSDDYGRTWNPIFDHEPTQSIGAIAVAPSDPNIIYVGSGEGLHRPDLSVGNGIYKSTDAGKTWTHLGLRDGQQIPALAVDPRDPNRVFAAVLGHPYGPSEERGIYRSTDGGQTWQRVISKDENTGGSDVEIDPSNPDVVYASMWEVREGPWEDNNEFNGTGGGLFKSTDGGSTWQPLTNGLPKDLSQIYVAIAPSDPRRLYATLAAASGKLSVYRSDDAGETWAQITDRSASRRPHRRRRSADPQGRSEESRPGLRGQHRHHALDRRRQNLVRLSRRARRRRLPESLDQSQQRQHYSARQRSGRDRHRERRRDAGVPGTTSPPRSSTTSIADNQFPYRVCAGQQESGSVCISSRGNDGAITFRDWHPVGVIEYGYVAPDPLDPDIVYGGGTNRGLEVSLVDRPGAERHADSAARPQVPHRPHRAADVLSGRSAHSLLRQPTCCSRRPTAAIPGRPSARLDARESRRARQRGHARSQGRRETARRDLRARAVIQDCQHSVGRHRRRPALDHARRRQELDQHHAARTDGVEQGHADLSLALRRADRLRLREPLPHRRSASLYLSHARRRQDLEADHRGPAGLRPRRHGARRSRPQGPAVRRHGKLPSGFRSTMATTGSRCN